MVKISIDLEKTAQIMAIVLGLFGLFIAYQIIRYLLGGSWDKEDLLLSLVGINIGLTFTGAIYVATTKSEMKYQSVRIGELSSKFDNLASAFRRLGEDFRVHVKTEHK